MSANVCGLTWVDLDGCLIQIEVNIIPFGAYSLVQRTCSCMHTSFSDSEVFTILIFDAFDIAGFLCQVRNLFYQKFLMKTTTTIFNSDLVGRSEVAIAVQFAGFFLYHQATCGCNCLVRTVLALVGACAYLFWWVDLWWCCVHIPRTVWIMLTFCIIQPTIPAHWTISSPKSIFDTSFSFLHRANVVTFFERFM